MHPIAHSFCGSIFTWGTTLLLQDVRVEVVNRLPLDKHTLEDVLSHQSDRSAKVAAAVYNRVARHVASIQPSVSGGVADRCGPHATFAAQRREYKFLKDFVPDCRLWHFCDSLGSPHNILYV